MVTSVENKLSRSDFIPSVDVRWCPGCGDYAILNAVQKVFPTLGIPKEKFVVVSGIGCSSRFPYYMNTYGFHTVHGRAPSIATGLKVANPDLSVWVVTGDGDGLSIGGNHLLHILRRNVDVNIMLFNNRIYGLTKGQYSPTSELGKVTKTSPLGSIDAPINPLCFAISSEATFVARTMDTNPSHMAMVFEAAAKHKGTSFIEIFQNCVIFNNQAWEGISGRQVRDDRLLMLEHGKPLIFGKDKKKGIRLKGLKPEVVILGEQGVKEEDLLVHDAYGLDPTYAYLLTQLNYPEFPTPMGVFRSLESSRPVYEEQLHEQIKNSIDANGRGNLAGLLKGRQYWEVESVGEHTTKAIPITKKHPRTTEEMEIMDEIHLAQKRLEKKPWLRVLNTPVGDILDKHGAGKVLYLSPDASISKAIELFKDKEIGCIPIMVGDTLEGILTERDIVLRVLGKPIDRDHVPISTIMTKNPDVIRHSNTIGDAMNKLAAGGFRHLPIKTKDGKIGLISVKGLVNHLYEVSQSSTGD